MIYTGTGVLYRPPLTTHNHFNVNSAWRSAQRAMQMGQRVDRACHSERALPGLCRLSAHVSLREIPVMRLDPRRSFFTRAYPYHSTPKDVSLRLLRSNRLNYIVVDTALDAQSVELAAKLCDLLVRFVQVLAG